MGKKFLYTTVFLSGMAVMAVELTASRLVAPYFGTSFLIWTNLIGVVLLVLSLGYYFGGNLDVPGAKPFSFKGIR
ncbi:MAG TPA: fused MFS/spermidine synthase [bacterium]|nr:fused MFS/spermidine synthase [bacterium]